MAETTIFQASRSCELFATDLFALRGIRTTRRLQVFLCGKEVHRGTPDLRHQVRWLLRRRMYCDAFLGEEIEELKQIRPDPDHLTIEMRAADRSDLIVMFLGSPGTFAELTAFAMTPTVNPKLLVFNEARFKDVRSFLSEGPLRLIDSRRKLYYDPASSTHLVEVARHLDQAVSALLFEQWNQLGLVPANLDFSSLVTLGAVFVTQPSPYRQLNESSPLRESDLRGALKVLLEKTLVVKDGERYRVRDGALRAASERHLLRSWSRVRLELMGRRIDQTSVVDDLRSLF